METQYKELEQKLDGNFLVYWSRFYNSLFRLESNKKLQQREKELDDMSKISGNMESSLKEQKDVSANRCLISLIVLIPKSKLYSTGCPQSNLVTF